MDPRLARTLLALNAWPGLGPARLKKLLAEAGSIAALEEELPRAWKVLDPQAGSCPAPGHLALLAEQQTSELAAAQAVLLTREDPEWPQELENLTHPPPLLFVLGSPLSVQDDALRVAVIGARACTPYGREQAGRFGSGLACHGATVVSGAARGIDQCAMRAAVDAGGRVVAVLGCGLDRPYPPDAAPLLADLAAAGGAVVSEFPFGMSPQAGNFPRRNRILAALCRAVVVVQATRKSGSMNTVAWALALGREVYAMPGPVDCAASQGPHLLLRDGAALAEGALDVLRGAQNLVSSEERGQEPRVLERLNDTDKTLAALAEDLGEAEDIVLLELVQLEMQGRVVRRGGGLYHRCGPARSRDHPPP
jgi:DNA processing protein